MLHKFFAFPVVDEERRILGLIDIGVFTQEVFDIAEREQHEGVFETIGFHVESVRGAGLLKAFRYRFPWLLATIGSGTACALLASAFALTLAQSLVIGASILSSLVATCLLGLSIPSIVHALRLDPKIAAGPLTLALVDLLTLLLYLSIASLLLRPA